MRNRVAVRDGALLCVAFAALFAAACSSPAPAATEAADVGGQVQFNKDTLIGDAGSKDAATDTAAPDDAETDAEDPGTDAAEDVAVPVEVTADSGPADVMQEDLGCIPFCGTKICGSDGCGGTCGSCGAKEKCSVGQCVTDPTLGCAGLDLAEKWNGTFKGDASFSPASISLVPIKTSTKGKMSFAIKCFNSKFLVSGTMDGEASGNKFTLTLDGTYDPTTKALTGKLADGDIKMWLVLEYKFDGPITGTLGGTPTAPQFDGVWSVTTSAMTLLGSPANGMAPFTASGTWSAIPGP